MEEALAAIKSPTPLTRTHHNASSMPTRAHRNTTSSPTMQPPIEDPSREANACESDGPLANKNVSLWDRLPTELQLSILKHRYGQDGLVTAKDHRNFSSETLLPLLLACKRMYKVAMDAYYDNGIYLASHHNNPIVQNSLWAPKLDAALFIRKLEAKFRVSTLHLSLFEAFSNAVMDWSLLIREIGRYTSATDWQLRLVNLQSAKIILDMGFNSTIPSYRWSTKKFRLNQCEVYQHHICVSPAIPKRHFATREIPMRPVICHVAVVGFHCGDYHTEQQNGTRCTNGGCARTLAERVKAMVTLRESSSPP